MWCPTPNYGRTGKKEENAKKQTVVLPLFRRVTCLSDAGRRNPKQDGHLGPVWTVSAIRNQATGVNFWGIREMAQLYTRIANSSSGNWRRSNSKFELNARGIVAPVSGGPLPVIEQLAAADGHLHGLVAGRIRYGCPHRRPIRRPFDSRPADASRPLSVPAGPAVR